MHHELGEIIAQIIGFTEDYLIERHTSGDDRLKIILCKIKNQARNRLIYEVYGLTKVGK